MKNRNIVNMVFCGLFAALTAVMSQISIPIGPVPINLATFSIFLAGAVLGAKSGALSQLVFVLLGVFGLPVFAGFRGGVQAIVGPTGGYIIGYIAAAWLIGMLSEHFGRKSLALVVSMVAGIALCYLLGTAWFVFITKSGVWAALTICVFPFLVGDIAKISVAVLLTPQLSRILNRVTAGQAA